MDTIPLPPESCSKFRKVLNVDFSRLHLWDGGEVKDMGLQRQVLGIFLLNFIRNDRKNGHLHSERGLSDNRKRFKRIFSPQILGDQIAEPCLKLKHTSCLKKGPFS